VENRENEDHWKGWAFHNTTIPCIKMGKRVEADAHIGPPGATPERPEKTYTPVPSALRADKGIGPYMEYAENGRSFLKCYCVNAAISQNTLFLLFI